VESKPEPIRGVRDLRFDTLRGLLLVCMTLNHLPTEMRAVTDQPLGVFSAAEGFVFLSGLMAGWIYTRRRRRQGPEALWSSCMARTKSIYLWHVASYVGAFAMVQLTYRTLGFCSLAAPRLFFQHPLGSLWLGFSLLYQPGLLDLLPMYCAFVLLVPAVIAGLEAGRRWLILGLSALVWLAVQGAPPMAGATALYPVNTGVFNLFAWQLIFIAGLAVGHARASGEDLVSRPKPWVVGCALAVVAYGIGIGRAQWPPLWPDRLYGILLNKPALGLLRMADFGCVAFLVSVLAGRHPAAFAWRPLALLGRHSLAVVAAQSVVIVTLLQFAPLFTTATGRTLTALATLALVFAAAAARDRITALPREAPEPELGARHPGDGGLLPSHGARAA
jgi:hypothetical protein